MRAQHVQRHEPCAVKVWISCRTHAAPHPAPLGLLSPCAFRTVETAGSFHLCLNRFHRQRSHIDNTRRWVMLSIWTFNGTWWWCWLQKYSSCVRIIATWQWKKKKFYRTYPTLVQFKYSTPKQGVVILYKPSPSSAVSQLPLQFLGPKCNSTARNQITLQGRKICSYLKWEHICVQAKPVQNNQTTETWVH